MSDYRTLENKIRDIVARPWTKDPKKVHHKLQQIQKKIIDEEPEMLNNKAIGIPDSVIEAAKQINKGKTEVDVNPQYKTDVKDSEDNDNDKKVKKEELKGKQHKLDKNKNGKVDAHDFKLLRKEEAEQVEEGGMPASVIKSKQNRANMSDKQFADSHKDKSDADLRSMAWRHGLGKPGTPGHDHYVNKRNKGLKEKDVELDEADSYSIRNTESDTDKIYHISKYPITANHSIYKKIKAKDPAAQIHKNGQPVKEDVELSNEEIARLEDINASFSEDAVQSAQKTSQQKMKAASITAKATVQADKIKDQARKQAQNNSYESEGEMVEEGNLAAQIRDAKPSITGHIEVSVGDKKVKIPHKKAQDFLGSYHSKRTPNEKDDHEKAFRKEIGG